LKDSYIRKIQPILKEVASLFNARGKQVLLVGGAVRDMFRGVKNNDCDLATDAEPCEVIDIFSGTNPKSKVIPTGLKHGTVTVLYKGNNLEITTFRTETGYSDGRRPDSVSYTTNLEEDLSRRDFTMNAMALRLPSGELVDPIGGEKDIQEGIIRCVGDAEKRFAEDGLRPLRAVRFAAQLGFTLEEKTLNAIPGALGTSVKVSIERVRDEINKIIGSSLPSRAFILMEKTGMLKLWLEELAACRGVEQKGYHKFDVLDHSLLACDYAARRNYPRLLRLAALLHDIGKPSCRNMGNDGVWTFYRHEEASRSMSGEMMRRLRYPNSAIEYVTHLVREHMFHYTDDWSDGAVRRFIGRVGEDKLEDLYCLRYADSFAAAGVEKETSLLRLIERVDSVLADSRAVSLKDLAVSGHDLIEMGIKPGKTIGIILNELLETTLNDPRCNTREKLMEIAGKIFEKIGRREN
jgi:tRNA nucleotidyltransferase/poly(A) polymerase